MDEAALNELSKRIIGCAYKVMNTLGVGFLEQVYIRALAHELRKNGLKAETFQAVDVVYDGVRVGEFVANMFVDDKVLVELRATKSVDAFDTAVCLNHLKATGRSLALLLNFGQSQVEVKRLRF
jgi:GxxExxY protein